MKDKYIIGESGRCDHCNTSFTLGSTIKIVHIGIYRRDLCEVCAERLLDWIDTDILQPVAVL